jgi:hypothetical protein
MRQMTPEQLNTALEISAGIAFAMTEAGKKEFAALTALKADVDAKVKAVGGLEQAEKVKAEADAYAADVRADADERADAAKAAGKSLQEWQLRLQAGQSKLDDERGVFAQDRAKHVADVARWSAGVEEQDRKIAQKEAGLKAQAEALERDRRYLAERESKFAAKLVSLKEPV